MRLDYFQATIMCSNRSRQEVVHGESKALLTYVYMYAKVSTCGYKYGA